MREWAQNPPPQSNTNTAHGNGNGNLMEDSDSSSIVDDQFGINDLRGRTSGTATPTSTTVGATPSGKKSRAKSTKSVPVPGAGGAQAAGINGTTVPRKKNRNPHATQIPGVASRKAVKVEAEEGHEGPKCSYCASVVTPLWRRGPDDELLCNA